MKYALWMKYDRLLMVAKDLVYHVVMKDDHAIYWDISRLKKILSDEYEVG